MDLKWNKLVANFYINVVMPSWNYEKKEIIPLPVWLINDIMLQIHNNQISFGQGKQRYKDCVELLQHIEKQTNSILNRE